MRERPIPVPTPDTQPFWDAAAQGRLSIQKCETCGPFFYPRSHCPGCGTDNLTWIDMSGRATLYSYVINHRPAGPGFEADGPYAIAIIELEEGPRMMANIKGVPQTPEALVLDMPLTVCFEQRGAVMLPQFQAITESAV